MPLLKPTRETLPNLNHQLMPGNLLMLFNEGTGLAVNDFSGRKKHATLVDAVWGPGKFGSTLDFNGSSTYGQLPASNVVIPDNNIWTIAVYFKAQTIGAGDAANRVITLHRGATASTGVTIATAYSDDIVLRYRNGDGYWRIMYIDTAISLNEWYHVAVTYDGVDYTAYENGIYANSVTDTFQGYGSYPADIGSYDGSQSYFDGVIDHIMIFNRPLTAAEVAWLYREPFCMFERALSPGLISGQIVNFAGSSAALSSLSATAKAIRKVGGTVASIGGLAAVDVSLSITEESSLEIERSWLREALFNGVTANAFKLGTTLSLGWFWVRVTGCSVLYRGPSMERIDFTNILTVAEQNACEISPPSYVPHNSSSIYFYVIRRFNTCGYQELTLAAAAMVSIDANGEPGKPEPNNIFGSKAEQVDGNKIRVVWFYCPLEQKSQPVCFNVYYDGGMGQIDYGNPLAKISYEGRKFYSYQSGALDAAGYLFTIRAEDADGIENSSSAQLKIQLDTTSPDAIDILSTETV